MTVLLVSETDTGTTATQAITLHSGLPEHQRVLIPTDFSPLANQAIPYGYSTLPQGGRVKLVTVIPPWELPGPLMPHYRSRLSYQPTRHKQVEEALYKLNSLIPPEARKRGIRTEVEVLEGQEVAKAIQQAAEKFGANLICLGSHGRSGISRMVLGSVAQKVMNGSRRPVLIVRAEVP